MVTSNWWGSSRLQEGFYEYGLSPFQQKLFTGFITEGGPKFIRRLGRQAMYIVPAGLFFYAMARYADAKYEFYNRKEYLMSEEAKKEHRP
ncbi:cytochrome b-c1 complex subunit 8 [Chytridium lagenaria]|nr:cytochrome b-c1 complex subunit 8 [Chytridium lagenaria]